MALTWWMSRIPLLDENGEPYSGAKAYFFNASTTTPRSTYTDAALSIPFDHPVVANANGVFPMVYLQQGDYRLRITDANDVTLSDDDGISTPLIGVETDPGGETDVKLLFRTGMMEPFYGTAAPSGWVRANGRTIGDASSGATERANADCEDLFEHLWSVDDSLTVSGGRGASAANDWAASKTIVLPDWRGLALMGRDSMGNSAAGNLPAGQVTGGNADALGKVAGTATHTLTISQMPAHDHTGVTGIIPAHNHGYQIRGVTVADTGTPVGSVAGTDVQNSTTSTENAHNHTIASQGGGTAHPNVSPAKLATILIKL